MPPETGWEAEERKTTLAEEAQFYTDVASLSDRLSVVKMGETLEGRDLNAVVVGYPTAPTLEAVAALAGSVLIVSHIHANEWPPREVALEMIRDLALVGASDTLYGVSGTDWHAYLADHPVVFFPTANPDGQAAGINNLPGGFNPNRGYMVGIAECEAVTNTARIAKPTLGIDCHTFNVENRDEFEWATGRSGHIDQGLVDVAQQAGEAIAAAVEEIYDESPSFTHISAQTPWVARNALTMFGVPMLLAEGNSHYGGPTMMTAYRQVLPTLVKWHRTNHAAAKAARLAALDNYTASGLNPPSTFPIFFGPTLDPTPYSYRLDPGQQATAEHMLDAYAVEVEPIDGSDDVRVWLGQDAYPLIPHLLDDGAGYANAEMLNVAGTHEFDPPPPPPPPPPSESQWRRRGPSGWEPGQVWVSMSSGWVPA